MSAEPGDQLTSGSLDGRRRQPKGLLLGGITFELIAVQHEECLHRRAGYALVAVQKGMVLAPPTMKFRGLCSLKSNTPPGARALNPTPTAPLGRQKSASPISDMQC